MSRLPTVRVKHPLLGAITINAADFGPEHELHPEQAADFDAAHIAHVADVSVPMGLDPAVRDLAAEIMIAVTRERLEMVGEVWSALDGPQQLAALRDAQADVTDLALIRQARGMAHAADATDEGVATFTRALDVVAIPTAPAIAPLTIAKTNGPRGLWYVMRGEDRASKGFRDAAEATAERNRMGGAG